jgi:hypothetical protein
MRPGEGARYLIRCLQVSGGGARAATQGTDGNSASAPMESPWLIWRKCCLTTLICVAWAGFPYSAPKVLANALSQVDLPVMKTFCRAHPASSAGFSGFQQILTHRQAVVMVYKSLMAMLAAPSSVWPTAHGAPGKVGGLGATGIISPVKHPSDLHHNLVHRGQTTTRRHRR